MARRPGLLPEDNGEEAEEKERKKQIAGCGAEMALALDAAVQVLPTLTLGASGLVQTGTTTPS